MPRSPARLLTPGIIVLAFLMLPREGWSSIDHSNAQLGLHIAPTTSKNPCSLPSLSATTVNFEEPVLSTPEGPFYFTYLVVCWASDSLGIGGIECGIDYPGGYSPSGGLSPINVFSWQLCGDLEFPSTGWPAPGGGTLVTWATPNCHHQDDGPPYILGIAGYFYMAAYGNSQMRITPRPVSGFAKVASCTGAETDLLTPGASRLGLAGFGSSVGAGCYWPPIPVRPTTWSGIKARRD